MEINFYVYCQAQPKHRPNLGCAGSIPSFSVQPADRPADQNSTFWSELDFSVKSKVVSLDVQTPKLSSYLNPINQGAI